MPTTESGRLISPTKSTGQRTQLSRYSMMLFNPISEHFIKESMSRYSYMVPQEVAKVIPWKARMPRWELSHFCSKMHLICSRRRSIRILLMSIASGFDLLRFLRRRFLISCNQETVMRTIGIALRLISGRDLQWEVYNGCQFKMPNKLTNFSKLE